MRNSTTDQLGSTISTYSSIEVAHKAFHAFDISDNQFFFIYEGEVVQAYRVNSNWYCKY